MKIGILCYPTHGGSGVIASELSLGLADRGHQVHIVSYATPFRLRSFHQNVFIHEVEVSSYPLFKYPPYALVLATKLVEVARDYGLDLIHAHYAVPHATSAYLAKKMLRAEGLKTITTLHGTDITLVGMDKTFYQVIKFNIEESDGVTAVSSYLQQRTIQEFSIQREIRVIPNFVDTSRYRKDAQKCTRDFFAPGGEKILMHASNFRPLKRVEDVIRIFASLRADLPVKLVLVGEGPEHQMAQQGVKELGLSADVHFLGEQDYMENILSCADLFLLPSAQESFGLAALEAQSCSVPVIASATGGLSDVVVDGETGFLLPVGDVEAMTQKARYLLEDATAYARFQKKARERAVTRYDTGMILPQYESFYREVLN